jgi:hypothetical protein
VNDLTRITVALPQRSFEAMEHVRERTGLSKTDVVARALVALEWMSAQEAEGAKLVARYPDGSEERVVFL